MDAGFPRIEDDAVELALDDPDAALDQVRLYQEVQRPRLGPAFTREGTAWRLRFPRPEVDRLEYQIVLGGGDGEEWITDPANPRVAPGPFGEKSVVEFPGYRAPTWLEARPRRRTMGPTLRVPCRSLRRTLTVATTTVGRLRATDELPLLVVQDGPEYVRYSALLAFLDRMVADSRVPPHHVALVQPGHRDAEYSASPAYARALARDVVPAVAQRVHVRRGTRSRVLMGASLGGLAALHAAWVEPTIAGGVFAQSPSVFRRGSDDHEGGVEHFDRIVDFVDGVVSGASRAPRATPVVLTCGTVEENLVGSREVAAALVRQHHPTRLAEVRDAHNWTAWRDALDPHLTDLLAEVFG